jgi:hypothetical protein
MFILSYSNKLWLIDWPTFNMFLNRSRYINIFQNAVKNYLNSAPWSINAYFTNSLLYLNTASSADFTILSHIITWLRGWECKRIFKIEYKGAICSDNLIERKEKDQSRTCLHLLLIRILQRHIQKVVWYSNERQE